MHWDGPVVYKNTENQWDCWNNTSVIRKNWTLERADTDDVKEKNSKRSRSPLNKEIVKALGVLETAAQHRTDDEVWATLLLRRYDR